MRSVIDEALAGISRLWRLLALRSLDSEMVAGKKVLISGGG